MLDRLTRILKWRNEHMGGNGHSPEIKEGSDSHLGQSSLPPNGPTAEIIMPPSVDAPLLRVFYDRLQQDQYLEVLTVVGSWELGTRIEVMQTNGKSVDAVLSSLPEVVEVSEEAKEADPEEERSKIVRLLTGRGAPRRPLKRFKVALKQVATEEEKELASAA